jgi:hypothetical protein
MYNAFKKIIKVSWKVETIFDLLIKTSYTIPRILCFSHCSLLLFIVI